MAAKTRVVIRAGEDEIELFSLRERADGDLVILGNRTADVEPTPGEGYVPVVQNRFSVHTNEDALGFTINHTLSLEDRRTISSASFVRSKDGALTWIILGKRYPRHVAKSIVRPKANDSIVCIDSYNPDTHSLILMLIVTAFGQTVTFARDFINYSEISFTRFSVHFAHCYLPWPAFYRGDELVTNTTPRRINGVTGMGPRYEDRHSMTQDQLDGILDVSLNKFSNEFVQKITTLANETTPFSAMELRILQQRARNYQKIGR